MQTINCIHYKSRTNCSNSHMKGTCIKYYNDVECLYQTKHIRPEAPPSPPPKRCECHNVKQCPSKLTRDKK